jgi:glycosyltransferase involved in cell wall biosynthesis
MSDNFRLGVFCLHDLRGFSSIPHYLVETFRRLPGVEVVLLSPGEAYRPAFAKRVWQRVKRTCTGRIYLWEKEPARCRHASRCLDEAVRRQPVDAVLLFGSENCAFSDTATPLFCYADSIFGTRIDLYPDQQSTSLSAASVAEGVQVQQRGLDRLSRLFISSRWAWRQGVARFGYRVAEEKIEAIGIGANFLTPPTEAAAPAGAAEASFLWVGRFWQRKGGDFALDVIAELRRRGVPAVLDVVGPVEPMRARPGARFHGLLQYEDPANFTTLQRLYGAAHALLLPSSGDTTPLAISEAFAFGRAVVATPVGGIPEMVTDGQTGFLLRRDAPEKWAGRIMEGLESGLFQAMGSFCRMQFETKFNWPRICKVMLTRMHSG